MVYLSSIRRRCSCAVSTGSVVNSMKLAHGLSFSLTFLHYWDPVTGECDNIKGKGHSNQVQDMAISDGVLVSVSMDDTIRFTQVETKEYG